MTMYSTCFGQVHAIRICQFDKYLLRACSVELLLMMDSEPVRNM